MSKNEAIKQAGIDIWLSIRKFNGKPDQIKFIAYFIM